jgi:hypothetical protein
MRRGAYDAEHFTERAVSRSNPQCSVLKRALTGSTGAIPELCLPRDGDYPPHEQVCHKTAFLTIGSRKRHLSTRGWTPFVPPHFASSARLKPAVSARRFL